jgi:hypothetical protein
MTLEEWGPSLLVRLAIAFPLGRLSSPLLVFIEQPNELIFCNEAGSQWNRSGIWPRRRTVYIDDAPRWRRDLPRSISSCCSLQCRLGMFHAVLALVRPQHDASHISSDTRMALTSRALAILHSHLGQCRADGRQLFICSISLSLLLTVPTNRQRRTDERKERVNAPSVG